MFLRHDIDAQTFLALLEPRHFRMVYNLVDRARDDFAPWLGFIEHVRSAEDVRSILESRIQQFAKDHGMECGIWHRRQLVGAVGLQKMDWKNRTTSLGYWLSPSHQGQGIATRAVTAMINHALLDRLLNRVEIRVAVGNERSRALVQRLGLRHEGTLCAIEIIEGRSLDHEVFGITAAEWNELRNKAFPKT